MLNPKVFFYDLQLVDLEFSPSSRDKKQSSEKFIYGYSAIIPSMCLHHQRQSQWNQGIIGLQSLQSTTCAGCYEQWATAADPRGAEGRQPGLSKELVLGTSKPAREEDNHLWKVYSSMLVFVEFHIVTSWNQMKGLLLPAACSWFLIDVRSQQFPEPEFCTVNSPNTTSYIWWSYSILLPKFFRPPCFLNRVEKYCWWFRNPKQPPGMMYKTL